MDIVLPLAARFRRGECSDLLRLQTLLRSAERFWSGGKTLRIITPDVDEVRAELKRLAPVGLFVSVHSDDEVFGPRKVSVRHWCRQQILKLAAHRIVTSDFYLVLDADCFFVRRTFDTDLVVNNKGRVSYGTNRAYSQGKWYVGCRKLGLPVPKRRVNMTPFVMHRELARSALQHVESRLESIATLEWSEYTLYHALAERDGVWDQHHYEGAPLLSNEVWVGGRALRDWNAAECFAPSCLAPLSLVQSSTGASAEWVWSRVQPYLDSYGLLPQPS